MLLLKNSKIEQKKLYRVDFYFILKILERPFAAWILFSFDLWGFAEFQLKNFTEAQLSKWDIMVGKK